MVSSQSGRGLGQLSDGDLGIPDSPTFTPQAEWWLIGMVAPGELAGDPTHSILTGNQKASLLGTVTRRFSVGLSCSPWLTLQAYETKVSCCHPR